MDHVAITLIQDLIEADLQLAWDHLQDGRETLAEHELCNALAKIVQIKELKQQAAQLSLTPVASPARTFSQVVSDDLDFTQTVSTVSPNASNPSTHPNDQTQPRR